MNERGVASSIRSLDLDVTLDHLNANVGCRCRCYARGNARTHQEGCKVAPCDVSGTRLVARLAFLFVCHGFVQRVYRISLADRTVGSSRALGAARSLAFLARRGCRSSSFRRERRPASCKNRKEPVARHSGNRNKIQLFDCCKANHNKMPQALPSPESLPDPSRWALVPYA